MSSRKSWALFMCPDPGDNLSGSRGLLHNLADNPLYEYLLDLQIKRIHLLETLAPTRHLAWQLWVSIAIISLWSLNRFVPELMGFPAAILVLIGPLALFSGPLIAGWRWQMLSVKNYPSPLDSPRALELLLSTPLTEKEIVDATAGAYLKYPFLGLSLPRVFGVTLNFAFLIFAIYFEFRLGTLPVDILVMSLNLYLPALCVFIYFPLLSVIDLLLIPNSWIQRSSNNPLIASDNVIGRSGRIPMLAMSVVLLPIILIANWMGALSPQTTLWILFYACPVIILAIGLLSYITILSLPLYLEKIRRQI
jgi:hypothetical protein